MRCKKHYFDLSSINGVCASCLRERLFSLVAAQSQSQSHQSENQPVFPRSVSPYISRRKSDNITVSVNNQRNSDRNRHHRLPDQRFFNTPQVGSTVGGYNHIRKKKYSFIRFSLLSNLFRSKNKKPDFDLDSDPRVSVSVTVSDPRVSVSNSVTNPNLATSSMSSSSWFSNIISGAGRRNKQPFCFNESSTVSGVIRKQYCPDRGMSPVRCSKFYGGSNEYESCESRKQKPRRTPAHPSVRGGGGGGGGNGKNVSGLTFCLSPLVRASPCRQKAARSELR